MAHQFKVGDLLQNKRYPEEATKVVSVKGEYLWVQYTDAEGNPLDVASPPFTVGAEDYEPYKQPIPKVGERWGYSDHDSNLYFVVAVDEVAGRWVMSTKDAESQFKDGPWWGTPNKVPLFESYRASDRPFIEVWVRTLPEERMKKVK